MHSGSLEGTSWLDIKGKTDLGQLVEQIQSQPKQQPKQTLRYC